MSEGNGSAPDDPRSLVYIIFYWLGIGTLLPWNFFISVPGYWNYKWDDVPRTNDTVNAAGKDTVGDDAAANDTSSANNDEFNERQMDWGSHLATASMVPNVTMLLLNAIFGHHFKTQPRLLVSLCLVIVLFIVTDVLTMIDTDHWQESFYTATLVCVVLININAAIFQGGLLGVAGKFPPQYMGGALTGQSLGGIFASVTNVIFLVIGPVLAATFSFLIAVVFLATALAAYILMTRLEFFKYYVGEETEKNAVKLEVDADGDKAPEEEDSKLVSGETKKTEAVSPRKPNPLRILGKIWLYGLSVFLVFCVTLGAFPAVTALVKSHMEEKNDWTEKFFVPVCCFVLFNIGDWLGRIFAEKAQWPKPGRLGATLVFLLSVLRFSFIPLFLLCNTAPSENRPIPVVFNHDAAYIIIMLLFSVTNGYAASISMMSAPQICEPEERQTASSLMVALLGIGLGIGSLSSKLWVHLILPIAEEKAAA